MGAGSGRISTASYSENPLLHAQRLTFRLAPQMADTDRSFEHFDNDFNGHVDPVEFFEGLSHLPGDDFTK